MSKLSISKFTINSCWFGSLLWLRHWYDQPWASMGYSIITICNHSPWIERGTVSFVFVTLRQWIWCWSQQGEIVLASMHDDSCALIPGKHSNENMQCLAMNSWSLSGFWFLTAPLSCSAVHLLAFSDQWWKPGWQSLFGTCLKWAGELCQAKMKAVIHWIFHRMWRRRGFEALRMPIDLYDLAMQQNHLILDPKSPCSRTLLIFMESLFCQIVFQTSELLHRNDTMFNNDFVMLDVGNVWLLLLIWLWYIMINYITI